MVDIKPIYLVCQNSCTLDAGLWTLNSGRWTLDAGLWTLATVVDCCRTESEPSFWFFLIKWLKILSMRISKDHGHVCSIETIGCDVAIFRNSMLTLSVTLWKNVERSFYCEKSNKITSSYLGLFRSTVHIHPFSKISPENTGGRVLILVKLQTDCSEKWLYTKMTLPRMFSWKSSAWTVQKHLSTAIHFRKFLQKILVVDSLFWLNYRLAVQSRDYILKWLH